MRKYIILFAMVLIAMSMKAQSLEELETSKKELLSEMQVLKDSLAIINIKIANLKYEEENPDAITVVVKKGGSIKSNNTPHGDVLYKFQGGEEIELVNQSKNYFKACYKGTCGFINSMWLDKEDVEAAKRVLPNDECEEKYGAEICNKIAAHRVWIGMSEEQARMSIGDPDDINTTKGTYGIHEQWVYDSGMYLYFENGVVTTIQD